jgi:hypothetical protein
MKAFIKFLMSVFFKSEPARIGDVSHIVIDDIVPIEPVVALEVERGLDLIDSGERPDQFIVAKNVVKKILVTKNFYLEEFKCPCGKCSGTMNIEFIKQLQILRNEYGKPMRITSAFRCPDYNKKVGGAANSCHLYGIAVDIGLTSAVDRHSLIKAALKNGFTGIGVAVNFVHLDLRSSTPVIWTY